MEANMIFVNRVQHRTHPPAILPINIINTFITIIYVFYNPPTRHSILPQMCILYSSTNNPCQKVLRKKTVETRTQFLNHMFFRPLARHSLGPCGRGVLLASRTSTKYSLNSGSPLKLSFLYIATTDASVLRKHAVEPGQSYTYYPLGKREQERAREGEKVNRGKTKKTISLVLKCQKNPEFEKSHGISTPTMMLVLRGQLAKLNFVLLNSGSPLKLSFLYIAMDSMSVLRKPAVE